MALTNLSVGLDGTSISRDALAWAVGAAGVANAHLRAIQVWTAPVVNTYRGTGPSTEELIQHARAIISSSVSATETSDVVDSVIVHGAPGPCLTAEATDADLLVIGRSNRAFDTPTTFGEVLVGSTTRYCVNHAAVPVAVIPAGSRWMAAPHVVVGVDGSATSLAALRWAANSLPADATIHAVHAMVHPGDAGEIPMDYELLDPIIAANRTQLQQLVAAETDGCAMPVRCHVIIGSALDILIDLGFHYDLVILGEHGETAAVEGVLGSVADHTLRHAPVPLIVVPSAG